MISQGRTATWRARFARDRMIRIIAAYCKCDNIDGLDSEIRQFAKDLEKAFEVHADDARGTTNDH